MKKLTSLFFMSLLAAGMVSCSSEDDLIADNNLVDSKDAVYMQFDLQLPTANGSRSATDTNTPGGSGNDQTNSDIDKNNKPDYEVGSDGENIISSVRLILADEKGKIIAISQEGATANGTNDKKNYVVKFQSKDLLGAALENSEKPIRAYVFCNPTEEIKNFTSKTALTIDDLMISLSGDNSSIWSSSKFLMSNANNVDWVCSLGSKAQLASCNTEDKAWELNKPTNPIKVERAAARFDFAHTTTTLKPDQYALNDVNGKPQVVMTFTNMALLNLSKNFYAMRRVSDDGTNAKWTLAGAEINKNFVVDTDWQQKLTYQGKGLQNNFLYPVEGNSLLTVNPTWQSIAALGTQDNWGADKEYYVWRYATENTIPATDASKADYSNQKNGNSTGIVFEAKITAADGCNADVKAALSSNQPIFVYNNKLYGTWANVYKRAYGKEYGQAQTIEPDANLQIVYDLVKETYNQTASAKATDDPASFTDQKLLVKAARESKQFNAVYKANATGDYTAYYYYWNRHNDNKDPKIMGPMEFSVVRNNVYKLKVTAVNQFGLPKDVPFEPNKPNETDEVFFKVSLKVLDWVVRENNIEF